MLKSREIEMVVSQGKLQDDQDIQDLQYWLSQPVEERLAAIEKLREQWYEGGAEAPPRLSRSDLRLYRRQR
jgi:hypothetical protein